MDVLQTIWFILVAVLLAAFYLTGGFDFGAGVYVPFLKTPAQRDFAIRSILPFWDANQVWLITAGGGLFAAFPKAYSTVLSQMYTPVMLLLMLLVVRVGAIEFYFLKDTARWQRCWGILLSLSSFLSAAVFGVALAAAFSGQAMVPAQSPLAGILGLFSPYGCLAGLLSAVFFCAHGAGFLAIKSFDTPLAEGFALRARKAYGWLPLVYILYLAVLLPHLEWHTADTIGLCVLLLPAAGAFLCARAGFCGKAFLWGSVFALGFFALHAWVMFPYLIMPTAGAQGLSIAQAASSATTLKIMLGVALVGVPLAIGYSLYAHRVFRKH